MAPIGALFLIIVITPLFTLCSCQQGVLDITPFSTHISFYDGYFSGSCFQGITDADQDVATIITDSPWDFHRCGTCYKATKGALSTIVRITDWCTNDLCGTNPGEGLDLTARRGAFDVLNCFPPPCAVTLQLVPCPVNLYNGGNIVLWTPSWVNDWAIGIVVINPLVEVLSLRMNIEGTWFDMPQQRQYGLYGGPEYINDPPTMISGKTWYIELTSAVGEKLNTPNFNWPSVPTMANQRIYIGKQFTKVYVGSVTAAPTTTIAAPTPSPTTTIAVTPATTAASTAPSPTQQITSSPTNDATRTDTSSVSSSASSSSTSDTPSTSLSGSTSVPPSSSTDTIPTALGTSRPGVTEPPKPSSGGTQSSSPIQTETNDQGVIVIVSGTSPSPSSPSPTAPGFIASAGNGAESLFGESAMVVALVIVAILAIACIALVYFAFFKSSAAYHVRESFALLTGGSSGMTSNPIHSPPNPANQFDKYRIQI